MTEQPQRPVEHGNPYAEAPHPTDGSYQPAYAYPAMPEHPQAATVLILGVLGLFVAVTGPFAWAIGSRARAEVTAGRYAPSTALTVGWVLGIVTTIYLLVLVLLVVLLIGGVLLLFPS